MPTALALFHRNGGKDLKQIKKLIVLLITVSLMTCVIPLSASASSLASGASSVTSAALNVRSQADKTAAITDTLYEDDITVVLDVVNDTWYHINYNGAVGYVARMYMSELLTAENFSAGGTLTGDDVRMRSTYSTSGIVLGTYDCGTVMRVIGINSGWYKVSYAGKTGYIRSDYMEITGDADSVPDDFELSQGQQIADYALQFVGYRYVYGASSPSVGFDCSGFTYYIYGKFGYSLSRTASQQYRNNGVSVSKDELQPGDLLFFSSNGGASVTHVGLYIGDGNFVHASTSSTGVIISSLSSSYYTRVWYGAKRIV